MNALLKKELSTSFELTQPFVANFDVVTCNVLRGIITFLPLIFHIA